MIKKFHFLERGKRITDKVINSEANALKNGSKQGQVIQQKV